VKTSRLVSRPRPHRWSRHAAARRLLEHDLKPAVNLRPLGTTLLACAVLLLVFVSVLHRLTGGFEYWTLEEVRRADAGKGRLLATAIPLRTAHGEVYAAWGEARSETVVHVVDFIYTRCPTVCQTLGSAFQRMQAELAGDTFAPRAIRLLSVSIDPGNDGPRELTAYADQHRADASIWVVAAPRTAQDLERLTRRLGIIVIPDGTGGYVHNGSIHVVDRNGAVRAVYDHEAWEQAVLHARRLVEARP
jgi:protein SCO1